MTREFLGLCSISVVCMCSYINKTYRRSGTLWEGHHKASLVDSDRYLHEIRETLNHELVLGRSYLKGKIEEITNRQTRAGQPGRPKAEEEQGEYLVGY